MMIITLFLLLIKKIIISNNNNKWIIKKLFPIIIFFISTVQATENGDSTLFEAAFQGECHKSSPCQQLCFDLHDGTFECACHDGYHLDINGYSCIKSNHSEENNNVFDVIFPPPPPPSPSPKKSPVVPRYYSSSSKLTYSSSTTSSSLLSLSTVPESHLPHSSDRTITMVDDASLYSCTDIECEAGGVCIETTSSPFTTSNNNLDVNRVRCRCPLGRGGQFCEKIVEVKQPRFMGTSYLALPTLRNAHRSLKISLEFKPESFNGVLLYSGQETNLDGDFIAIILTQGFVEFRFDCGMGSGLIRSDIPVILNSWNIIDIYRDGRNAWMRINQGQQIFGHSKGLFSRITFRLETFLGGSPNISQIKERINVDKGLNGCIRSLKINDRDYDLSNDTIDGIDIEQCNSDACNHVTCLNGGHCVIEDDPQPKCICPLSYTGEYCETQTEFSLPSFNGSSYLQFIGFGEKDKIFTEIFLVIKPSKPNGLFLYNGQRMDKTGDFISLNLIDGYVEFRFDLGSGAAILRSPEKITMKEWHTIYASRTGREGILRVDDQPVSIGLALGAFIQLSLPLNLYVGGVPHLKDLHHNVNAKHLFNGCIQRIVINGHQYSLVDDVLSGVNIDNCHHLCTQPPKIKSKSLTVLSGPCKNYGICQPWNHHYICHCLNNKFIGQHCEQERTGSEISYPMFYGNSFLKYTDQNLLNRIRGYKTIIHLNLRAFSSSGLILWLGEPIRRTVRDYFTIGLNDGHVVVDINLGSGTTRFLANRTRIDDGQWHKLDVIRIGRQCLIHIDQEQHPAVRGQIIGPKSQLNVPSALYLGGLEDTVMATDNRYDKGFIGCISNMTIDQNLYVDDLLAQSDRGINIRTCI